MSEAADQLQIFVQSIIACRALHIGTAGEASKLPPLSLDASIKSILAIERLFLPFHRVNRSHNIIGKLGECYKYAYNAAAENPNLIYCEGYACPPDIPIPVMHAWCIDKYTHEIWDPTWLTERTADAVYCGLPFSFLFVIQVILKNKVYGVLDGLWRDKEVYSYPIRDILHKDFHHIIQ